MDETAAAAYAEGAEFNRVDPPPSYEEWLRQAAGLPPVCDGTSNPDCASASNYALQNIHYAHTATLSNGTKLRGQGTLIAVVDDGFRRTHREFAGKTLHSFIGGASFAVEDHGTSVAGIAAGRADGAGIMGVAPEADLHLTSWADVGGNDILDHLTAATDHAADLGAVVQNNSWGFAPETAASEEMAAFARSGTSDYATYIAGERGGTPSEWRGLFDAYDRFQETGVVVLANSNDPSLGDASAWAGLPLFVPELSEAWLVASNALFTVDESDGRILDAELLSAPCGSAAAFCVTSDGTVYAPTADDDTSYAFTTGTSFAAPQVAGQVALIAQAFPNLSPEEWTVRLLATARRDWDGFQDTVSGTSTFAPGVSRNYSSLYGHGVPDMKAALSPIGGLSIASGENVYSAQRTSLSGGIATAGPVVGNSIAKAIAGRKVMVVDALGTDFYVPGGKLGGETSVNAGKGVADARQMARNVEKMAASFAFVENGSDLPRTLHDVAVPKLFFSQTLAGFDSDTAFSHVFPADEGTFFQFSGQVAHKHEGGEAAFSLSRITANDKFASEISFSFGHSGAGFFGSETRGPFLAGRNTANAAAGISVSTAISRAWSVGAYAEFGSGFVSDAPHALVDYGALAYASGGLSARRRGVLTERDTIDFYGGMRPSAVAGEAEVNLPVGRDADGTIHYENIAVDLADTDLPLRFGLVYRNRTERDFDVLFGFNTDLVAASDPDPVFSFSLGLTKEF
ncbi:S8 family peptidase [Nitratireductor sp. GCM10026969]|uniref:S8 family peptidase n=1 Tax=Nitratireductor sp. GCM10026969 TaxID=3252645 RepID=UPI003623E3E0